MQRDGERGELLFNLYSYMMNSASSFAVVPNPAQQLTRADPGFGHNMTGHDKFPDSN